MGEAGRVRAFPYAVVEAVLGNRHAKFRGAHLSTRELSSDLISPVLGGAWSYPFVSVVRKGVVPPLESWTTPTSRPWLRTPVANKVVGLMADGYTLKVQNVELGVPGVRRVLCELERRTRRHGSAVFFMTPGSEPGLSPHHDDTDVVVEQVQGVKRWQVWAPDGEAPLTGGLDHEPRGVMHEVVLEPGDFLYVPRGWSHVAHAEGDVPSMHISYCLREHPEWRLFATRYEK